jgi:hypothetical protein
MPKVKQANQWIADPRQEKFLSAYLDPKSDTWSNALQSALKAGYEQEYAENITHLMPNWLSEAIGDNALIAKALVNLQDALDGMLDEEGKPKGIQWKATETTLKALMKDKFSERKEITGADGKDLKISFDPIFKDK